MKTKNITSILTVLTVLAATHFVTAKNDKPNTDKFVEAMQKNIKSVYEAQGIDQLQTAVNAFERISAAEKTKWEPLYYAAFGYIMMSNTESEAGKKDAYLDQAMATIDKAKVLAPDESEIMALEGFAYMLRLAVDPASRGAQFSGLSMQSYHKALALNPENPRALALLAQMQYGTAQFFGSSTAEACTTLDAALKKFESYKSDNLLAPAWGKPMAESMKANCK